MNKNVRPPGQIPVNAPVFTLNSNLSVVHIRLSCCVTLSAIVVEKFRLLDFCLDLLDPLASIRQLVIHFAVLTSCILQTKFRRVSKR